MSRIGGGRVPPVCLKFDDYSTLVQAEVGGTGRLAEGFAVDLWVTAGGQSGRQTLHAVGHEPQLR